MMNAAELESPVEFYRRVRAECEGSIPLGAYADRTAAHYVFAARDGAYALSYRFGGDRRLRAVSHDVPLFSWDEREMAQEFEVVFDDIPDPRPLRFVRLSGEMPAAVVADGSGLMHFVVGPVHAGIIEPGRFTFSSGGETVVHLDAQLGYAHRRIERTLAGYSALEAAEKVARICGGCSASRSFAYARALERLAGVDVTEQVDLARLVVAELERIYNHLGDLAASASAAGFGAGFAHGMALKERAMRLNDAVSGHRLLFDAIVPGGLGEGIVERSFAVGSIERLDTDVRRYLDGLFSNASVVSRWRAAGIVTSATATAFGATGPASRASRGNVDLRAFSPYGAYRAHQVVVGGASSSDAYARCATKRDEIVESFRLIRPALAALNETPLPAPTRLVLRAGAAIAAVEGPRGSETVAVHVDDDGCIERIHVISASYRNWPIVALAMNDNIVPDFPLVNKSFNLCYACADR